MRNFRIITAAFLIILSVSAAGSTYTFADDVTFPAGAPESSIDTTSTANIPESSAETALRAGGPDSSQTPGMLQSAPPEAVSARFLSASVDVSSDLTLHVSAEADMSVASPAILFSDAGRERLVYGVKSGETWAFEYSGICFQCMTDTIHMSLLDGETVLAEMDYSICRYFNDLYSYTASELGLNNEQFAALKRLLADILEFGAASQLYTGYRTSDLSNSLSWVESERTQNLSAPEPPVLDSLSGWDNDYIKSATLCLSNYVRIRFRVAAEYADRLVITNGDYAETIMLADCICQDGLYQVALKKLSATEFDKVWEVSLTDSRGITYCWREYSANAYIAAKYKSSNEILARIVSAMYKYGVSAKMYLFSMNGGVLTDGQNWGNIN